MATGRNLLGHSVKRRMRVWYWNGEDPLEEVERRVAAILLHYDIRPKELKAGSSSTAAETPPSRSPRARRTPSRSHSRSLMLLWPRSWSAGLTC